jgi:hypothetical protein
MIKLKKYKIWTILIFIQYLIYENVVFVFPEIFGGSIFKYIVYSYKVFFPLILFQTWKFSINQFLLNKTLKNYTIFIFLFMIWAIVPTFFNGNIIDYLKLFAQFFFFIGALGFFSKNPKAIDLLLKILILYVLFALVQYSLIVYFEYYGRNPTNRGLVGPFGILGNNAARIGFLDPPIIRMTGFWREPSNFSGAAFAAYFLSRYFYSKERKKQWKLSSFFCLLCGFLSISNAGYLAFGFALGFLEFFKKNKKSLSNKLKLIFLSFSAILLVLLALMGRNYITENKIENPYIRAIAGVRSLSNNIDTSSGRLEGYNAVFDYIKVNPIGIGVQVTGSTGIPAPAGAPMYWLYLVGIPGVFFLLMRDFFLFKKSITIIKTNSNFKYICLAYIVIFTQQAIYGSWIDPNILIFSTIILINNPKN